MLYRAVHSTRYTYEGPVSHCLSEARLTPRILPTQRLLDWNLTVHPRTASILSRKDYFGNDVTSFSVLEPHTELIVTAASLVELLSQTYPLGLSPTWEDARRRIAEAAEPDTLEANGFLWESPFVPWLADLDDYTAPIFTPGQTLFDAASHLMNRIHADFKYEPESTSIETPLLEVLASRRGVCQDFAHLMIGALRARGLAARYVSGYLRGDADLQGAQASHAWVSVFMPGHGWLDFDPTNNVMPSTTHLTLAWGRDYGDIPPVKGITMGGGKHTLEVDVRVRPA